MTRAEMTWKLLRHTKKPTITDNERGHFITIHYKFTRELESGNETEVEYDFSENDDECWAEFLDQNPEYGEEDHAGRGNDLDYLEFAEEYYRDMAEDEAERDEDVLEQIREAEEDDRWGYGA